MGKPLLTREEECRLCLAAQAGYGAAKFIKRWGSLYQRDQLVFLRELIADGDAATTEMIMKNTGLAGSLAKWHERRNCGEFEDLFQDAVGGLLIAISRFDPDRGTRFSTYAVTWIKQQIQDSLRTGGQRVYVPKWIREQLIASKPGERPTVSQRGKAINPLIFEQARAAICLRASGTSNEDNWLSDVPAKQPHTPEYDAEDIKPVLDAINEMKERDRLVLHCRFGVGGQREMSLADVGKIIGVTKERVRQIEKRAFQRLCKAINPTGSGIKPRGPYVCTRKPNRTKEAASC